MNPINFLKQHKVGAIFAIIAAGLVLIAVSSRLNNQSQTQTANDLPAVSLVAVADYAQAATVNLDNGIVESMKQADLKAQISAQIVSINAKLGDNVIAGQTLAKLQDRDINAQLEQAQAKLDELKNGARPEDIRLSQTSADEAKTALVNSIKDSYAKSDDAIHNHIDKFFVNPRQSTPEFIILTDISGNQITFHPSNDDQARKIANQKFALEELFSGWQKTINLVNVNSNSDEIENAAALSKKNLQTITDFLNTMAPIVNDFTSGNSAYKQIIDGYKADFSTARITVSGALSALQGSQTAARAANNALELKLAGASTEQIRQAQAAVDTLKAALAKTSIIAPISGKISYIAGNIGELASTGQLVASIVNPNALQVKSYASENDLPQIAVGDFADIDGGAKGIVSNASPAIDAQTKKAEVIIAITQNGPSPIVIGQSVSVRIAGKQSSQTNKSYLLPIQAIQFSGNENYVLSIGPDQKVAKIAVATGEIVGENIYVTGGLAPDMKIISSVRGLKEGDSVSPQ